MQRSINLNRRKSTLTFFFFILGAYLLWSNFGQIKNNSYAQNQTINAHQQSPVPTTSSYPLTDSQERETRDTILGQGLSFCPELKEILGNDDKIKSSHTFGHNIHFKKEGKVHRIRIFTEDGDEGSFEKLVYFIEDDDGFAQIRPIDEDKSINPKQEYIISLLQGTETIYDSIDITYELASGKSFNASFENGKLNKITTENINCEI